MTHIQDGIKKVRSLSIGEETTINWFQGGGGLVVCVEGGYRLYEVPQYGGKQSYEGSFADTDEQIQAMVETAFTWI